MFATGGDAAKSLFVEPLPGNPEAEPLRGDGYFSTDLGLSKRWILPWGDERHSLQLRWEVFNVTNSVRFDVQSLRDRSTAPVRRSVSTLVCQPTRA